ncbi:MAG: hypothetical protein EOP06_10525, partial [Proteobacteria bacterium]
RTLASREASDLDPTDAATQPQPVLLSAAGSKFSSSETGYVISYPPSRGEVVAVVAGGERIKVKIASNTDNPKRKGDILDLAGLNADAPSYRRAKSTIGILRMPTMTPEHATGYTTLTNSISSLSDGREKVVIVDLRNNGGGSLFIGPLLRWFSQMELLNARSKIVRRVTSKVSALGNALTYGYLARQGHLDEPVNAEQFKEVAESILSTRRYSLKPTFEVAEGTGMEAERKFDLRKEPAKPIFLVLVDNGCGSNCEAIFGLLSGFPNVITAGTFTYGVGEFGNVGDILLPRTKVGFRIATNHNEIYADGRSFDSYGGKPDILLDTEKTNSPSYILELAESLAELIP